MDILFSREAAVKNPIGQGGGRDGTEPAVADHVRTGQRSQYWQIGGIEAIHDRTCLHSIMVETLVILHEPGHIWLLTSGW